MRKTAYFLALAAVTFLTFGCVKTDEKLSRLKKYISSQSEIGLYRDSKPLYTFDKSADQYYVNRAERIFRIQNDDATRYIELKLSAEPVKDAELDIVMVTAGYDEIPSAAYNGVTVTAVEGNRYTLTGGPSASYTGFIIVWVE